MGLVVLASSIWMGVDASRLGYDKRDVRGLAAMGPVGWFFCGLLLWIVAFPLYLIKRPELKAAGEQRRRGLLGGYPPGMIAGAPWTPGAGPSYGQPQYGPPQYCQPQYGQPQYGQPQYGPPQYGQPQYGQPQPPPYGTGYGAPPPTYGAPGYPQPAAAPDRDAVYAEIIKLDQLRAAGLLTDEEFQRKKSELLART
jgi:hypothetical protein